MEDAVAEREHQEDGDISSGRKVGRKRLPVQEERRRMAILERWYNVKGRQSRRDFCKEEGITTKELDDYINWLNKRQVRDSERKSKKRASSDKSDK